MLNNIKAATKDTLIYSLGNISSKIIGLVLLPLYTERLTIEEYGVLGTVEITIQILVAAFGMALVRALNRWYWDRQYRDKQGSIFFTVLVSLFFFALMMVIVFSPFTNTMACALLDSSKYTYLFNLLLICAALQIISRGVLSLIRLQRKPILFTTTNVLKLAVTLGLTIYFIVGLERGVEGVFEAQGLGFLFFILINLRLIIRHSRPVFEIAIFKEMVRFSYPLALSSISSVLLTVTDRYVIRYIDGMDAMGLYSAGFKIANVLKVFLINSLNSALMPLKYQMMDKPNNKRFYSKLMTYSAFVFIVFLLFLSLYSEELLKLLAKKSAFWAAYQFVPILCFAQFFELLRMNSTFGLVVMKKTKIVSIILILVSLISIGLNVLLIQYFGTIGAAVATMLAQGLFFGLIYHYAQKYYYIPYELKKIAMMGTVAVIIIVISNVGLNSLELLPRILFKLLLIIFFPVALYFLKFYESIELVRLKESWYKWKDPRKWKKNLRQMKIK